MSVLKTPPTGYLKANGAAVSRAAYASLDAAIYCGDSLNASAGFGYRCTNPSNPSGSRSTTGAYIVLPDLRGEFIRGWDDGRGVDSGRVFATFQGDLLGSHNHGAYSDVQGSHAHNYTEGYILGYTGGSLTGSPGFWTTRTSATDYQGAHAHNIYTTNTGGAETRPRNISLSFFIRY